MPLDEEIIVKSLRKTGRVMIAEPSCKISGVGAEISAMLIEKGFDYLDAPIIRVAAPHMPAPFSPALQDFYIPKSQEIVTAVRENI